MQFLWKYVDDVMGKGLEWYHIVELLFYASANLVPMALPLAILLSSIMTFGNLAERSELTAMKSAGMSLFKIMRPMMLFIFMLSVTAFFFSNNLWPVANLKFKSLLWDITEAKPTFSLKPGIFNNDIPGYSIRISGKDEETGVLQDVLIYDHTNHYATNNRVIRAETGVFEHTADKSFLFLTLENGAFYEEYYLPKAKREGQWLPHVENHFRKQIIRMDMSEFRMVRTNEDLFAQDFEMLNLAQLVKYEDTMWTDIAERKAGMVDFSNRSLLLMRDSFPPDLDTIDASVNYMNALSFSDRTRVFDIATNQVRNIQTYYERQAENLESEAAVIDRYRIEWHRKFTLSFACVILFFIGAPLGAIIRRGGLGMPVVISVILFLIFHVISITGEKMVKTGALEPWTGMWLSSMILFPLGLFLTIQAAKESQLFSAEAYIRFFRAIGVILRFVKP